MSDTVKNVTIEGKDYELRLTRKGLRSAENAGLDTDAASSRPMTQIPLMFMALTFASADSRIAYPKAEDLTDALFDSGEMSVKEFISFFGECYGELLEPTTKKKKATKQ